MTLGFLIDATNCIGCHTCAVACKDANSYELGVGFRKVHTYCTGEFPDVRRYNVSFLDSEPQVSPKTGKTHQCDYCAHIQAEGEQPACVAACPMRVLEWGDIDELAAKYADRNPVRSFPALEGLGAVRDNCLYIVKDYMSETDYDFLDM